MSKEYIERETAKKVLADDYAYNAAKLLDTVPAADVQEVVRCKDCRWSDYLTDVSLRCNNLKVVMPPFGFCCYGEIRSEQE